ncbi:MAG: hypothetical protein KJP07_07120 [Desulfatitalea sp.]|nr:hypothetical protein [Desulfatitalea sp.]
MKRTIFAAITVLCFFSICTMVHADLVSITFDEEGIELGDSIDTQYANLGVTWTGSNAITIGSAFSNAFAPVDSLTPQVLQYNSKPTDGQIHLATQADYFSIDFRRPSSPGDISLTLWDDVDMVYDFGVIGWSGPDWEHFAYYGSFNTFDRIVLSSPNKFVLDNLEVNLVPIPSSIMLLFGAIFVPAFWGYKRRCSKA